MTSPFKKSLSFERDSLLPHRYRKIGIWTCGLGVPVVLLINSLLLITLDLDPRYWDEWGLYLIHVPLSVGLYWILFAEEKNEDEFYLSLRLRAIARGVMMIIVAIAMLPVIASVRSLIIGREIVLPDAGGNMAVCTLLLIYANAAYFFNKSRIATDG